MDTLEYEQIKELQEHRAIKHGGWKLLVGIIAALCAFSPMIGSLAILLRIVPASLDDGFVKAALVLGGLEGLGGLMALVASRKLCNVWPLVWFHDYWRRNVRGYVARCSISDVTEDGTTHARPSYAIRTRKEDDEERDRTHRLGYLPPGHPFAISLTLGGWITRSTILTRDQTVRDRLEGWSVKLRAIFGTGAVMVEVRHRNRRWGINERIVTDIGSAFRHLEYVAADTTHALNGSWSDIIAHLNIALDVARREHEELEHCLLPLVNPSGQVPEFRRFVEYVYEQVRRLVSERDAARGEVDRFKDGFLPAAVKDRDVARQEREEAVAFIAELDRLFEESSRLHDKLQALRIHERIRERLYFHRFPTAWETSVANAAQQHDADAGALAEVRARIKEHERRDRRRHGKGAAPAAT